MLVTCPSCVVFGTVEGQPIPDCVLCNGLGVAPPTRSQLIVIAAFLRYSFKDIDFNYDNLTEAKKKLGSREDFIEIAKWAQEMGLIGLKEDLEKLVREDTEKLLAQAARDVVREMLSAHEGIPGPPDVYIGYWAGHGAHPSLPNPQDHVDTAWRQTDEAEKALIYLETQGHKKVHWRGESACRFKDCRYVLWLPGSADMTDGRFVWPEAYPHYLDVHAVKPPQAFLDHVNAQFVQL